MSTWLAPELQKNYPEDPLEGWEGSETGDCTKKWRLRCRPRAKRTDGTPRRKVTDEEEDGAS